MRVARLGPFIGLLLSVPKRFRTSLPSAHFLTPRVFFPNGKLRGSHCCWSQNGALRRRPLKSHAQNAFAPGLQLDTRILSKHIA
jgi:hypothetical protein